MSGRYLAMLADAPAKEAKEAPLISLISQSGGFAVSGHYLSMLADAPAEKAYEAEKAPLNTLITQSGTLDDLLSAACQGTITTPNDLRMLLAAEDLDDLSSGRWGLDTLRAMADALQIRRMRMEGRIPAHYTSPAVCCHCGPVFLPPGFSPELGSCPWCLNRRAGLPIPRPPEMGQTSGHGGKR